MTYILAELLGGFRLAGTAAAGYFGSALLIGLALIPAGLRTYQLFARNDNGGLELIVELLRILLVAVMILVGRNWRIADFLDGSSWRAIGNDVARAWQINWPGILLQLAVVTGLILAFNTLFENAITPDHVRKLLTAMNLNTQDAQPTSDAIVFAVKNFIVIPIYLMAMLQALGVVTFEHPSRP